MNPATGEPLASYPLLSLAEAGELARRSARVGAEWRELRFIERAQIFRKTAQLLRDRAPSYAELMAREMGKPVREGRAEIQKCAWGCQYYAENAKDFLRTQLIDSDASNSYVHFEPLGVVLCIMPWNFPFWQALRFLAGTLMAGNTALLKHSSLVPGCAQALEQLLLDAGAPAGVLTNLCVSHEHARELIAHDAVAAVTFTGSTRGGRSVAERAGAALKKIVVELGGSDPYLILHDADVPAAAEACVQSRLGNNGQSCIAAKRCIVVAEVREQFQAEVLARVATWKSGDPLRLDTQLGPLASVELREHLHSQVRASIAGGATLLSGGVVPEQPGAWYPPTVLCDVGPGMPAYDDELFGPVFALIEASDEEAAIRIGNDTRYGLGAAVFSRDRRRAERIAKTRLRAGSCFVNEFVRSDPRLPFGGIKQSGYGRELSLFGIREFVNIKTVYVK